MPDFLSAISSNGRETNPWFILYRLLAALVLGAVVAWICQKTTRKGEPATSLPTTLVLLSILIAMVTQVIGDSVARAFSLVGALSIVRFRTVVRDTRDTAFVIFAVIIGMAVGSQHPWVAVLGIIVGGGAAFAMAAGDRGISEADPTFALRVRTDAGLDPDAVLGGPLDERAHSRRVVSILTSKQGSALDTTYEIQLRAGYSERELVITLSRMEGVQDVRLVRQGGQGE